jgi:MarR family transcriptional regulator, transcriptional regulator for hemolysin
LSSMGNAGDTADELDLLLLLGHAGHALSTELTARLAEVGITPRAHCVLAHALHGQVTQSDLAHGCGLDKTTMVVTLDELERAGLARRRPSPTDRRARIVEVTAAGRRRVGQADEIVANVNADVLSTLPARDRHVFTRALRRLVEERLATPTPCEPPVRRRRVLRAP